jgi:hypothetical protein
LGCPPIKAARELGSERRETVDTAVYKSGYLLETPSIPRYSPPSGSDKASGADNQQGSPLAQQRHDPSETARQDGAREALKIQSELHGDMQSQAEMTWPSSLRARE